MNWINAKDRLPENDRCVLVIVNGTYGNGTWIDAMELASYYPEGWFFDSIPDYEPEHGGLTVSYWMELPAPPEGKPTNADRIRAMSDEELAILLDGICSARERVMMDKLRSCGLESAVMLQETPIESRMRHLNWLRQPAEEVR